MSVLVGAVLLVILVAKVFAVGYRSGAHDCDAASHHPWRPNRADALLRLGGRRATKVHRRKDWPRSDPEGEATDDG